MIMWLPLGEPASDRTYPYGDSAMVHAFDDGGSRKPFSA